MHGVADGGGLSAVDACEDAADVARSSRPRDSSPSPRRALRADAHPGRTSPDPLSPLRRAHRAGAVGANPVPVHARVRGRGAPARSRLLDLGRVPSARPALDQRDAPDRALGRGVGRASVQKAAAGDRRRRGQLRPGQAQVPDHRLGPHPGPRGLDRPRSGARHPSTRSSPSSGRGEVAGSGWSPWTCGRATSARSRPMHRWPRSCSTGSTSSAT
jgi:hypothetical protein